MFAPKTVHQHTREQAPAQTRQTAQDPTHGLTPPEHVRGSMPFLQRYLGNGYLQSRVTESATPQEAAIPSVVHDVVRSPGQPLDPTIRSDMESRFDADFSQVRVHTDAKAAAAAQAVQALAYTVGSDIVFGAGAYRPGTPQGRHRIAHELAHTEQQTKALGGQCTPLEISHPRDSAEREADRAATSVMAGRPIVVVSKVVPIIQRQPLPQQSQKSQTEGIPSWKPTTRVVRDNGEDVVLVAGIEVARIRATGAEPLQRLGEVIGSWERLPLGTEYARKGNSVSLRYIVSLSYQNNRVESRPNQAGKAKLADVLPSADVDVRVGVKPPPLAAPAKPVPLAHKSPFEPEMEDVIASGPFAGVTPDVAKAMAAYVGVELGPVETREAPKWPELPQPAPNPHTAHEVEQLQALIVQLEAEEPEHRRQAMIAEAEKMREQLSIEHQVGPLQIRPPSTPLTQTAMFLGELVEPLLPYIEEIIGLVPIIGNIVAAYEVAVGRTLLTQRELSTTERGITVASIVLPMAGRVLKAVPAAARILRAGKGTAAALSHISAATRMPVPRLYDLLTGLAHLEVQKTAIEVLQMANQGEPLGPGEAFAVGLVIQALGGAVMKGAAGRKPRGASEGTPVEAVRPAATPSPPRTRTKAPAPGAVAPRPRPTPQETSVKVAVKSTGAPVSPKAPSVAEAGAPGVKPSEVPPAAIATSTSIPDKGMRLTEQPEIITIHHGTGQKGLEGLGGIGGGKIFVAYSPGEHQDFSQGFYLSRDVMVAQSAAVSRGAGGLQHILRFDIPKSELGTIVNIEHGGAHRAQWEAYLQEPPFPVPDPALLQPGMRTIGEYLSGLGSEKRGIFFERFLKRIGMEDADTVFGPIGDLTTSGAVGSIHGESTQIVIRSQRVADRLNQIIRGTPPPSAPPMPAAQAPGAAAAPPVSKPGQRTTTPAERLGDDDALKLLESGGETGGFEAVGPGARIPVNKESKPARVLEVGAGPKETNLGLPPDTSLVEVKPTDIQSRPGVEYLDATKPVPAHFVSQFDTAIINNPRDYTPDIAELGEALRPGGLIIVQGRGRIGPPSKRNTRGFNPDFQKLLDEPPPPGFEKYITRKEGALPPAKKNTPADILGGPEFYKTKGDERIFPNARVIFIKVASKPVTPAAAASTKPAMKPEKTTAAKGGHAPTPPVPEPPQPRQGPEPPARTAGQAVSATRTPTAPPAQSSPPSVTPASASSVEAPPQVAKPPQPAQPTSVTLGKQLSHGGDIGTLGSRGAPGTHGVFEANMPDGTPVAVKVYPDTPEFKDMFPLEMQAAEAVSKTSLGPRFYGEVQVGPGRRAFAMEHIKGDFPVANPSIGTATHAQEMEAKMAQGRISDTTLEDVRTFGEELLGTGYYYRGEVQGLIDTAGRYRPIDFQGVRKLSSNPIEQAGEIKTHWANLQAEIDYLQRLRDELHTK